MLVSLTPSPPRVQANTEMCDVIRKFAVHVVPPHRAASISNRTASEAIRRWTGRRRAPTAPGHHHPPLQSRNQNRLIRLWKGRLAIFDFGQQCQCTNTCYLIEHKTLRDSCRKKSSFVRNITKNHRTYRLLYSWRRARINPTYSICICYSMAATIIMCVKWDGEREDFFSFSRLLLLIWWFSSHFFDSSSCQKLINRLLNGWLRPWTILCTPPIHLYISSATLLCCCSRRLFDIQHRSYPVNIVFGMRNAPIECQIVWMVQHCRMERGSRTTTNNQPRQKSCIFPSIFFTYFFRCLHGFSCFVLVWYDDGTWLWLLMMLLEDSNHHTQINT